MFNTNNSTLKGALVFPIKASNTYLLLPSDNSAGQSDISYIVCFPKAFSSLKTSATIPRSPRSIAVIPSCLKTNEKQLMISIKYFSDDKLNNYDVADKLECLFARSLKVNDRFLNTSNIEPNFLVDEVGDMLDFLIYITYFDDICIKKEEYELMQELSLFYKK